MDGRTKDDRRDVKVAENGVDEADLLRLWPDDVCVTRVSTN